MTDPSDSGKVYLNGRWVPAAEAMIPVADHGLLYGMGFFETFRTSGGQVHHWEYHRRRLDQACARLGFAIPASFLAHDEVGRETAVRTILAESGSVDAVFRYTITAGAGGTPSEFLTVRPLPASPDSHGIRLRCLKITRDNGEWLPRPKSLNYANAMLGSRELRTRGADEHEEGLFLTRDAEFVVETARQNLAWIVGGRLRFPDPALGGVAGTCLAWMLEREPEAQPVRASFEEFLSAEAILVCNAVRGFTPVKSVNDRSDTVRVADLESWKHPLFVSLQQRWAAALNCTAKG
jgi:4-amino-4-deoxychorismate lyase